MTQPSYTNHFLMLEIALQDYDETILMLTQRFPLLLWSLWKNSGCVMTKQFDKIMRQYFMILSNAFVLNFFLQNAKGIIRFE